MMRFTGKSSTILAQCSRCTVALVTWALVWSPWCGCWAAEPGGPHRAGTNAPRNDATTPLPQSTPIFIPAHEALLKKKELGVIDVYFLGDSITRRWQGTDYPEHKKNWDANFHGWNAANFGWGGDSTQNVLWRLSHGELDDVHPKVVVVMVGTNNIGPSVPAGAEDVRAQDVANGIGAILDLVREKAPAAKIVLMAITPRNENGVPAVMPTIDKANALIAGFADGESIVYLDINDKLADAGGKLVPGVTEDGLHLSVEGYQIWADALKPYFTKWLGPPSQEDRSPPASGIPEVPPAKSE